MTELALSRTWRVGPRLDGGGFGEVFIVHAIDDGTEAVAKLVPKDPGADRELLFTELDGVRNVIPVIDQGETADSWVIVMPRAAGSLKQHRDKAGGSLHWDAVRPILIDIATALADLEGRVVHRDLKPANVLMLDAHWCLADFGISRYAEATTAPDTQKYALSAQYAAPERWRFDRADAPTDIYSLGIIAFELLAGALPFTGSSFEDFRDQHLHADPPPLGGVPAAVAALVAECMFKAPGARPTASNLLQRLDRMDGTKRTGGLGRLEEANQELVERRAEESRAASEHQTAEEHRRELEASGRQLFVRLGDELRDAILEAAPSIELEPRRGTGGWSLRFGQALLSLSDVAVASAWRSDAGIDVVMAAELQLRISGARSGYEGRSHSLWFADAQKAGEYQWFETAFMYTPMLANRSPLDPFALAPGGSSAGAIGPGIMEYQVAWPFTPLTVGELDDFIDRWGGWFADASKGLLQHPPMMPERDPNGSWRR